MTNNTNNNVKLINSASINGVTFSAYSRDLKSGKQSYSYTASDTTLIEEAAAVIAGLAIHNSGITAPAAVYGWPSCLFDIAKGVTSNKAANNTSCLKKLKSNGTDVSTLWPLFVTNDKTVIGGRRLISKNAAMQLVCEYFYCKGAGIEFTLKARPERAVKVDDKETAVKKQKSRAMCKGAETKNYSIETTAPKKSKSRKKSTESTAEKSAPNAEIVTA